MEGSAELLRKLNAHLQECPSPPWRSPWGPSDFDHPLKGVPMFVGAIRDGRKVWLCDQCGAEVVTMEVDRGEEAGPPEADAL